MYNVTLETIGSDVPFHLLQLSTKEDRLKINYLIPGSEYVIKLRHIVAFDWLLLKEEAVVRTLEPGEKFLLNLSDKCFL